MSALPLAGPSSPLRSNAAEVRRVVNWEPVKIDSGTGKGGAQAYLKQCPGLRFLANIGTTIRGIGVAQGRLFAATSDSLLEVASDWTTTTLGSLPAGDVDFDKNETQLVVGAGGEGYVVDLATTALSHVTTNWPGAASIEVLDGYGVLVPEDSNHFYLTANQDFKTLDPLQFASAESSPGNIVAQLVKHRQLILLKETTGEVWFDSGSDPVLPFARDDSIILEVGCAASRTLRKIGGIAFWLGRDDEGHAVVFAMPGAQPAAVSSDALNEKLGALPDLSGARAWTYHQEGLLRYVLNVPGLSTTWVYNAQAGIWHERGEWVDGAWQPWRATCHALAFGLHIVGDAAGNLYEMTPTVNAIGGDVLRRSWVSPHNSAPTNAMQRFGSFEILCDVGEGLDDGTAATMLMRYSNDGGRTWQSWNELTLGAVGETQARARDTMLGSGRDRVWEIAVTDDVACNIVTALVNES